MFRTAPPSPSLLVMVPLLALCPLPACDPINVNASEQIEVPLPGPSHRLREPETRRSMTRLFQLILILALVSTPMARLPITTAAGSESWVAMPLGSLMPDSVPSAATAESGALDVNAYNVVVGYAATSMKQLHAFRWQNGVMEALPRLPDAVESGATAINDAGVIVGQTTWGDGVRHATTWAKDMVSDLGTLDGRSSMAWDVNMLGMAAGWAETANGQRHAAVWQRGEVIDLGTLGGDSSEAYGVSSDGSVVGMSQVAEGAPRPFVWQSGVMRELPVGEGALGGYAVDINPDGVIVGVVAYNGGLQSAAIWMGDRLVTVLELIDPGVNPGAVLLTESTSIADTGLIAGSAGPSGAAIWQNGKVILLPAVDRFHSGGYANGVNLHGWIVGISFIAGPEGPIARATLWVPADDAADLELLATPVNR